MNLLKLLAIFALLYFGMTILLRIVLDRLYRNILKRYMAKENRRLAEEAAPAKVKKKT
jgi:hypothetical protein